MNAERRTPNVERRSGTGDGVDRPWDLEDRLLHFGARVIHLVESLPRTRAAQHLGDHLLRAGTSPGIHHGEAESAESRKDFVHKLQVCLKELRESLRVMKLLGLAGLVRPANKLDSLMREADELIRIFVQSIRTAEANGRR